MSSLKVWIETRQISQTIGVELDLGRHTRAVAAWQAASSDALELRKAMHSKLEQHAGVRFIQADVLSKDLQLQNTSYVYAAGLCFPNSVVQELGRALGDPMRFPKLRAVASLVRMDSLLVAPGWQLGAPIEMQMSWGRAGVLVYRRKLEQCNT